MVVIVLLADEFPQWGSRPRDLPVQYVSCVFVNDPFLSQVQPGETIATTKEEEWISKKKTELTTTRQIETRVKRQVVLEDGKIVEDSGPIVTTNTSEDTEKQEHQQTELRKLGEDEPDSAVKSGEQWVVVPNPEGVVREVKEKRVISREETEQLTETEDVHHLGDITDEEFLKAVQSGDEDLRAHLSSKTALATTGPRVVHQSTKSNKVTDTEDTAAISSVTPDGRILTQTRTTTQHEEVQDRPLEEQEVVEEKEIENSQRYVKTKDEEFVEYLADGVKIGKEMRYKGESMEGERHGEEGGEEPHHWDSLSARMRRQRRHLHHSKNQIQKQKGLEEQTPTHRHDFLTKKPLDFDEEEETRRVETSKWLEHHFGSESTRSSRDSLDDLEPQTHSKSFFNVTIKSQPTRVDTGYVSKARFEEKGLERRNEDYNDRYRTIERTTPYTNGHGNPYVEDTRFNGHRTIQRIETPVRQYRVQEVEELERPVPPERRRAMERRQRSSQDSNRYDSGYRTHSRNEMSRDSHDEPQDEPPPDYSPPPHHTPPPTPPPPVVNKKSYQKTRFANDPPKHKTSIGQSIRKLVGKLRSASSERRKQRPPSPSYQQYNVIDNIPRRAGPVSGDMSDSADRRQNAGSPVQRYYLGEDPFGGSIYGRENKYDGVRPRRRYQRNTEDERSHSTLGRFSKSTSKLPSPTPDYTRSSQTLPRNMHTEPPHSPPTRLSDTNSTINVSIINTVSQQRPLVNGGPAKPARTYKSNLSRSKSFNVHENGLYKSNPALHRLDENPIGLKSPGIVSSLNRSQRDLTGNEDHREASYTSRYIKNGYDSEKKHYKTHEEDKPLYKPMAYSTPVKSYDMYEPPTRLKSEQYPRRGSNSTEDFSETYHITSRSDNPKNPSVTNTVQSFSKKTVPSKNGRAMQTIESTETRTVTKSRYREPVKYENGKYNANNHGVVIEVKNYRN